MQGKNNEIDTITAQERMANAISRLEQAILARDKKIFFEETIRRQVIKELDTYIANLENLLNPKNK